MTGLADAQRTDASGPISWWGSGAGHAHHAGADPVRGEGGAVGLLVLKIFAVMMVRLRCYPSQLFGKSLLVGSAAKLFSLDEVMLFDDDDDYDSAWNCSEQHAHTVHGFVHKKGGQSRWSSRIR